jgi:lysophospholipase L1-like esterase
MQKKLQAVTNGVIPSWPPVGDIQEVIDLYGALSGTVTAGTSGPVGNSLILAPGATVSLPVDYVDYFATYYKQSATLTKTLKIIDSNGSFTDNETTTTGTADSKFIGSFSTPRHGGKGTTFTIKNTGSNNLELNGLYISSTTNNNGPIFQYISYPGKSTANFTSTVILTDIDQQTIDGTNAVFVIALGSNDIYGSDGIAVPSATYIANIATIASNLTAANPHSTIVLTIPLVPQPSLTPVFEPLVNYTSKLYGYAQANGYDIIDFSTINGNYDASLFYSDSIHPTAYGYQVLADFIWERLGLNNYFAPRQQSAITPTAPYTTVSSCATPSAVVTGTRVTLSGCLYNPSSGGAVSYPFNVGSISGFPEAPRFGTRYLTAATNGPASTVSLGISYQGVISAAFGAATLYPQYIFLDGLSYDLSQ